MGRTETVVGLVNHVGTGLGGRQRSRLIHRECQARRPFPRGYTPRAYDTALLLPCFPTGRKPCLMLVLIDESGDPGFRPAKGSTSHFVIAMVIFDDFKDAERTSAAVAALREELRIKPEFKFTKAADCVRDRFFDRIKDCNFRVRALVVDKGAIYSPHLRTVTDEFYRFFLRQLLGHDQDALLGASIKIDGSGDAEFKREMVSYLRRQLPKKKIAKFKFVDSKTDNLVQLADMCAGAILRSYRHDGKDNKRWLHALRRAGRIDDIWPFR